jgi:ADP-ribose pyrophosphatase
MPQIADQPESWPVVSSTDLHRDDWVVAFRSDQVTTPDDDRGESFRRLVVEHPGAAMVLAIDEQERVFCLKQYRHPARRRFVELPAGVCDQEGEDPRRVAARELREEGELEASEWHHLLSVWASPGVSAEQHHLYLARGLSSCARGDFVLEHEEADMEGVWVPLAELRRAILSGDVANGPMALAVLAYDARFGGA